MARSIPRGFVYVHVSIHESERKYIKVERINFYKLNFELRPEIKLKGIRSCIVMDYKTWNNGTEWRFNTVWKFTGNDVLSDALTTSCRDPRENLSFSFSKRRWTMPDGSLKFYQKGERTPGKWTIEIRRNGCWWISCYVYF